VDSALMIGRRADGPTPAIAVLGRRSAASPQLSAGSRPT
jgi:hypothetical protein